ncbi:MAG: hypothetical protein ACI9LO_000816 [Planctomycetota bacterium]|jgi:hypothetical protein
MNVNRRKVYLSLFIGLAILLSSTSLLDDYADRYTSESIKHAAITYATARGINALVSMMQSSNVSAGIGIVSGSMTIGELLDPINDLIERFSGMMTLALASLAGQKVLLLIASNRLFLYLLAFFGLVSLLLIWYGQAIQVNVVFRCFLVLVFIRFSLGLAVAMNSGVDLLFLQQEIEKNDQEIAAFQENLLGIDTEAKLDADSMQEFSLAFWRKLDMAELNAKIGRSIENFINLVAIYFLKTAIFPLFFFYLMLYGIRQLWRLNFNFERQLDNATASG